MGETDPEELADRLEDEANDLERHSEELGRQAKHASEDWERKRSDPSVPGAPPPEPDQDDEGPPTGAPSGKDANG